MLLKNHYYYFQSAIPKDTCDKIVSLGLNSISHDGTTAGSHEKSANPNNAPQGELTSQQLKTKGLDVNSTYIRDSKVSWLRDQWLYDLFLPYIEKANIAAGWNWEWDYSENFQFTIYEPGQFYSWHKDGVSDNTGIYKRYIYGITQEPLDKNNQPPFQYVTDTNMVGKVRKISMTVSLNDSAEYDGGNLKFDFGHHTNGEQFHECEEIRPKGSIIVFPSFLDHCVTPVTRGTRYSLVLWCLGKPFK